MRNNMKKEKINLTILYMVMFLLSVFAFAFWVKQFPYDYYIIAGIGIVSAILFYIMLDEIFSIYEKYMQEKKTQHEEIMKSQKALYLQNKRNHEEIMNVLSKSKK